MSKAGEKRWVTQAVFNQLQSELDERSDSVRAGITRKTDLARREGDLKKGGGCYTARNEQAHNKTRILELREILKRIEVGEAIGGDTASPGYVTGTEVGKHRICFLLGSHIANEGIDINVFSPNAPLGAALLEHRKGDQVEHLVPTGKKIQAEVLSVSIFEGQADYRSGHIFPL